MGRRPCTVTAISPLDSQDLEGGRARYVKVDAAIQEYWHTGGLRMGRAREGQLLQADLEHYETCTLFIADPTAN